MPALRTRLTPRLPALPIVIAAGVLLAGCAHEQNAQFFTAVDVPLRSGQGDESSIVAQLPRGTPVVPAGWMGSECNTCWKVETPQGTGWVYTPYLTVRLKDAEP